MEKITNFFYTIFWGILDFDYIGFAGNIFSAMTFEWFIKMIVIYILVIWMALVIWVIKDIINRTNNLVYQVICILIVLLLTPLWIFIYLLIRPSKTLFEKYYEENFFEEQEIEESTAKSPEAFHICVVCTGNIQPWFLFCPSCGTSIKSHCKQCKKEISQDWQVCPYCWEKQSSISQEHLKNSPKKSSGVIAATQTQEILENNTKQEINEKKAKNA